MIVLDPRSGSALYAPLIEALGCAASVSGAFLPTDAMWLGEGPDGIVQYGAELKTISDLLSALRDGRLENTQIGPLITACEIRYLIITGHWRRSDDGYIETAKNMAADPKKSTLLWKRADGSHLYATVHHKLLTICHLADVTPVFLPDEDAAAAFLAEAFMWSQKSWQDHTTGTGLYVPPIPRPAREAASRIMQRIHGKPRWQGRATVKESWLHSLPHIGQRAIPFAPFFKTPAEIASYSKANWLALDGIGKKSAEDIWNAIHTVTPLNPIGPDRP